MSHFLKKEKSWFSDVSLLNVNIFLCDSKQKIFEDKTLILNVILYI